MKEHTHPTGYISTGEDSFYIRVDKNGVRIIQKDMSKAPSDWKRVTTYPNDDLVAEFTPAGASGPATATVINQKGEALPNAGGPGTTWMYLLGCILLIGCGIILTARRKIGEDILRK